MNDTGSEPKKVMDVLFCSYWSAEGNINTTIHNDKKANPETMSDLDRSPGASTSYTF